MTNRPRWRPETYEETWERVKPDHPPPPEVIARIARILRAANADRERRGSKADRPEP